MRRLTIKLLTVLVVPRPIAWITRLGETDVINLAPCSFFNAVGSDPLYLVAGVGRRDDGSLKDRAANSNRGFAVNVVKDLLAAINLSAADFLPD